MIVNRLTHKSTEEGRERERDDALGARCTVGRPARPGFQREKSFASCALVIEEETAPPLRVAGRSSRFWTVESTSPLLLLLLLFIFLLHHRTPLARSLGSLPRSVMKVLQVERAACDNKAIHTFIYNWPTYFARTNRSTDRRAERRTLDMVDGAGPDRACSREGRGPAGLARWDRVPAHRERVEKWKRAGERVRKVDVRKISTGNCLVRRESCAGRSGRPDGRTALPPAEEFVFLLRARRVDPRDRYGSGATGTRERPGESTTPDVQWTFQ